MTNSSGYWVWVLRTQPGETNLVVPDLSDDQALFLLARTNDFDGDGVSDALERLVTHTDPAVSDVPIIISQPLSQEVAEGDAVSFSVSAAGSNLSYQWTYEGDTIAGATASAYSVNNVQGANAGGYAALVTSGSRSVQSSTGQLTVVRGSGTRFLVTVSGERQNYTFRSGVTYQIRSRVLLHGATAILGDSVIKFDPATDSSLVVLGVLASGGRPYYPAVLSSLSDDAAGELTYWGFSPPVMASNGVAFLNLDNAQSVSVSNLWFRYADQALTTPLGSRRLDLWDCQFLKCRSAVVGCAGAVDSLHNVLLSGCAVAVTAAPGGAVETEQVTADVETLWTGPPPSRLCLTNSIIMGVVASGPSLITQSSALNPAGSVFQMSGQGHYYLPAGSSLRTNGAVNISGRLLDEFKQKTTAPPLALPSLIELSGEMTLSPQAARYTGGPIAIGFWYDALDFTVAEAHLKGASVQVLPGTALAVRNEYSAQNDYWTVAGFWLHEGASFVSHGFPDRPNMFTAAKQVQEAPSDVWRYQLGMTIASDCAMDFNAVLLVPDFEPNPNYSQPPTLDFRFSNFSLPARDFHVWSGLGNSGYFASPDSSMYWTLRDSEMRGGQVRLGTPDGWWFRDDAVFAPGAVTWVNNVFDQVAIGLDPTWYWQNQVVNSDISFEAYNNLFRRGPWFFLGPFPGSSVWTLKDNLFDAVDFEQDWTEPLVHDYNAYVPRPLPELDCGWWGETNRLAQMTNSDGSTNGLNDVLLSAAPAYQVGPLGGSYLSAGDPQFSPLHAAGSRPPADAGLYHYTSRLDQMKDADQAAVNIGCHYVAAGSSGAPLDYDGDGIADYVETECGTDWQNAYTSDGIHDSTNTVYDEIDLSGNGIIGCIKQALGMAPLDASNPLSLARVAIGGEPDKLAFSVNVAPDALTNVARLQLTVDSKVAAVQQCDSVAGTARLVWNTTYDGSVFAGDSLDATFSVTLGSGMSGAHTAHLHPVDVGLAQWTPGGPYDDFSVSYAWDTMARFGLMRGAVQGGVVDALMQPQGQQTPYHSTWNDFTSAGTFGQPRLWSTQADIDAMLENLGLPGTRNFHFDGHGSMLSIGDKEDVQSATALKLSVIQVATRLGCDPNADGPRRGHPYRFVFLNACDTADDCGWANAFGIRQTLSPEQVAAMGAQAFLGWKSSPRAPEDDQEWLWMGQTYKAFYSLWMRGFPLSECKRRAMSKYPYDEDDPSYTTLYFPLGKNYGSWSPGHARPRPNDFELRIYGYPRVTRNSFQQ